jgi:hypothetical protein
MSKAYYPPVAGLVAGVMLTWLFTPRPKPDTSLLDALRDSVAVVQAQATRDSARIAIVDDSLRAAAAHSATVTLNARLIVSAARQRAAVAEAQVRATLDSLGASTAALDSLTTAHADEIAAKDAEITALDRERAILYRRVELSDTVIAGLREQVARWAAVDAERAQIQRRLEGGLRGAKIRERIAEAAAVAALTWKVVG